MLRELLNISLVLLHFLCLVCIVKESHHEVVNVDRCLRETPQLRMVIITMEALVLLVKFQGQLETTVVIMVLWDKIKGHLEIMGVIMVVNNTTSIGTETISGGLMEVILGIETMVVFLTETMVVFLDLQEVISLRLDLHVVVLLDLGLIGMAILDRSQV